MQPIITAFVADDENGDKQQIVIGESYGWNIGWQGETEEEKSNRELFPEEAEATTTDEEIVIEGEIFGESFFKEDSAGE